MAEAWLVNVAGIVRTTGLIDVAGEAADRPLVQSTCEVAVARMVSDVTTSRTREWPVAGIIAHRPHEAARVISVAGILADRARIKTGGVTDTGRRVAR